MNILRNNKFVAILAGAAFLVALYVGVTGGHESALAGEPGTAKTDGKQPAAASDRKDHSGNPLPPGAVMRLGSHDDSTNSEFAIETAVFSPDGKWLASTANDRLVRIWNTATRKVVHTLGDPEKGATLCLAFSPDSKTLATAGADKNVHLWDVATGKASQMCQGHEEAVLSVAFSPDGKTLASASEDHAVRLWSVANGKSVAVCKGHAESVTAVAFAPNGKVLAAGEQGGIRLWDVAEAKELQLCKTDQAAVNSMGFSPDGKRIFSAEGEGVVEIWEVASGKQVRKFTPHGDAVNTLTVSPDGKLLLTSGEDQEIHLWDAAGEKSKANYSVCNDDTTIKAAAFLPDGKGLITATRSCQIRRWDLSGKLVTMGRQGHEGGVSCVAVSPNGKLAATGGQDRTMRVWDLTTGNETLCNGHEDEVRGVAFSPDSKKIATISGGQSVQIWDAVSGKELLKLEELSKTLGKLNKSVTIAAFSRDGKSLTTAGDDQHTEFCDTESGKVVQTRDHAAITGIPQFVQRFMRDGAVAISSDGKRFVVAGQNMVRLWDLTSGGSRCFALGNEQRVEAMALSRDGRYLVTSSSVEVDPVKPGRRAPKTNQTVHLWEMMSGRQIRTWNWDCASAKALAFSPDGLTLATISEEPSTLHFWDVATGKELSHFQIENVSLTSIAFTPDGRRAITGGNDGAAMVWEVPARPGPEKKLLTLESLTKCWADLADPDPANAYAAAVALGAYPEQAIPLLEKELRPSADERSKQQIKDLIADLDHPKYAKRKRAAEELVRCGTAKPYLLEAMKGDLPLEARKQIEWLLICAETIPETRYRPLRALAVLEAIGTPEAKALLTKLTQAAPDSWLAQQANASLELLGK